MMTSTSFRRRLAAALVITALCLAAAALFAAGSPALGTLVTTAPTEKLAPAESVLVVRTSGDHDAVWRLSPVDGTPTAVGDLPGRAGQVAVSPDGLSVAYLPVSGAARVWIGYGPLGPRTISLASAGVRRVDSFTWISATKLVVAGVKRASALYYEDRLYVVNASTGKISPFHGLFGTEPSYAPGVDKVAYVRLTKVAPRTPANGNSPTIRESLRTVRVAGSGAGRTIRSEQYTLFADHRSLSWPKISPDGAWLLTGETGSDVRVYYTIRDSRWGDPLLSIFAPALQAEAGWDAAGQRTAFAGTPSSLSQDEACVWAYAPVDGTLARTPGGLLPNVMVTGLAWSAGGDLVAGAWDFGVASHARHVIVLPGDLTTAKDLGTGRLPVWVP